MFNKKIKIILVTASFMVMITILGYFVFGNKDNNKTVSDNNKPISTIEETNKKNYISGIWYSDQDTGDTLNLYEDGSYASKNWLISGTYSVEGDSVLLTDSFSTTKKLIIMKAGNENILFFDNKEYSHTYYRTEDEANNSKQEKEIKEAEKRLSLEDELPQILQTGVWVNSTGDTTLTFSNNELTIVYVSQIIENEIKKRIWEYDITDVKITDKRYKINWELKQEDGFVLRDDLIVTINENMYELHSSALPYARTFEKQINE